MTALEILARLVDAGHEALFVGGAVRDHLLGRAAGDWDVATSATPDQVIELFADQNPNLAGKQFGVVIIGGVEVATFRGETYYVAGKPETRRVNSFREDASRRDFTINAMGMTPDGKIVDFFGGRSDLKNRVVRAVGDPRERFREDPARLLRAVTLAARLGFVVEPRTAAAIREMARLAAGLPRERVAVELKKVIRERCFARWLRLLQEHGLLGAAFPDLVHLPGLTQNLAYHDRDVWEHTLAVVDRLEQNGADLPMLLAGLYHDAGKGLEGVRTFRAGQPRDAGHEKPGAEIARRDVLRLGLGKDAAREVHFLVRHHMRRPALTRRSVTRMLRRLAEDRRGKRDLVRGVCALLDLMEADARAMAPGFAAGLLKYLNSLRPLVEDRLNVPFYVAELAVSGRDLLAQGFRGPEIGRRLRDLLLQAQAR